MKKTLYLASVLRKCGNGLPDSNYEKNRRAGNIVLLIFAALIIVGLFFLGKNLTALEPLLGSPYVMMSVIFMAGTIVNIVFEIPGLIQNLYMGEDNYILLGLPYSPLQIVVARVLSTIYFPLGVAAVATFPIGIGFMVENGASASLIITLIFAFISIMCISMSFDVAIVVLIISLIRGFRNRDSLKIFGAIILLIILGAWIIYANSGINENSLIAISSALSSTLWILPVNFAFQEMFAGNIILPLLAVIAINIAFIALAGVLAKLLYLNGVLKMQDTASANGAVSDDQYKKYNKKTSMVVLVAKRDFYLTSRNPAHLTNSYLFPVIMPIIITIALCVSSMSTFLEMMPVDTALGSVFIVSYITPFMTVMGSALGSLSYTCISREGASFDMLRILPLPFETIIKGKELLSYFVYAIPMALITLIGTIVGVIGFGMKAWAIPYALVYSLLLSVFSIDRNMTRDMKSPNLVWDNEGLMIKNASGFRSVLIMFLGMLLAGISVAVCMTKILAPYLIPFNLIVSFVLALLAHRSLNKWTKKVALHLNM